jgi:hypothetical protein
MCRPPHSSASDSSAARRVRQVPAATSAYRFASSCLPDSDQWLIKLDELIFLVKLLLLFVVINLALCDK